MTNPHYLKYLAELGATNLHAHADAATERLKSALSLEPNKRVLEIGCGTGSTLVKLAAEQLRVDGVDALEEMLRIARIRVGLSGFRNYLIQADAAAGLPFCDEDYDAVFTESVLGIHSADRARIFLHEVWRVLKPGGRFVANEGVWKSGTPPEMISSICRACIEDFGFSFASSDGWSAAEWIACMESAGLHVIRSERLDPDRDGASRASFVSRAFTFYLRAKAALTPRIIRQRRRYQQLLNKHVRDVEQIETRLFVAIKPRITRMTRTGA